MKLLLDMNLSPRWVPYFEAAGVAAVHWSAVGQPNASDREVMHWARTNEHVVFTNDLDFSALLAMTRGTGPSVLQLRLEDLLPDAVGDIVLLVLLSHATAFAEGAIVTVTAKGTRVRVLPLRTDPA